MRKLPLPWAPDLVRSSDTFPACDSRDAIGIGPRFG